MRAALYASLVLLLGAATAAAHAPYFGQRETILLPDGRSAELRLLYGDGVFHSDPVRLTLFDDQRRPLARGPRAELISLLCGGAPLSCVGYDHGTGQVLAPDPSSFRMADRLNAEALGGGRLREDAWALESGPESWGFASRPATMLERLWAEAVLAWRYWPAILILAGLSVLFVANAYGFAGPANRSAAHRFGNFVVGSPGTELEFAL